MPSNLRNPNASTALVLTQEALFKQVTPAIGTQIYQDGDTTTYLEVSGLTDDQIPLLPFLTITPVLNPVILTLSKVVVRIVYNGVPLFQEVPGVVGPLNAELIKSNTQSLVLGSTTYTPFQYGLGSNHVTYGTVVDNDTAATAGSVPTVGYTKTSTFTLGYFTINNSNLSGSNTARGNNQEPVYNLSVKR